MARTYWDIMDKDESFIKALGKITSRYALLEELITGCINILLGGEGAAIVTAGLPFYRSLNILGALYRQKYNITQDEDYPMQLKELLSQAENAEEERNKVIHSIWKSSHIKESLIRIKRNISRKKGMRIDTEIINVQELNDVADIIQNCVKSALEFTYEILNRYYITTISPADHAILDTKPEFSWQKVEGATGYELMIYEDPACFKCTLSKKDIKDTKYKCEITLEQNLTYYWRVCPIIATETGYWSPVLAFTIG